MQSLTHIVVSSERERQIAYTAAYMCSLKIFPYPGRSLDEITAVGSMLFDTCSHSKDIRVEYYLIRLKTGFFGQQTESPAAYFNFTVVGGSLTILVKSHYHNDCTQASCLNSTLDKEVLTLFK